MISFSFFFPSPHNSFEDMVLIFLWLLALLVCPLPFDIRRIILHLPPVDFRGDEEQDFTAGERMGWHVQFVQSLAYLTMV